jgi:hypothetical protein
MKLDLYRKTFTDRSTIGDLHINGLFYCYTLEDTCREQPGVPVKTWKVYAKTAIPTGVYPVTLTMSPRFKKVLPLVDNVEGFVGIRIHAGNKAEDTEGCILVGSSKDRDFVGSSRITMEKLMDRLEAAAERGEKINLAVHGTRDKPAVVPQK